MTFHCLAEKDIILRIMTLTRMQIHTHTYTYTHVHTNSESRYQFTNLHYNKSSMTYIWSKFQQSNRPWSMSRSKFLWRVMPLFKNPDNGLQLEWRDLIEKSYTIQYNLLHVRYTDVCRFLRISSIAIRRSNFFLILLKYYVRRILTVFLLFCI